MAGTIVVDRIESDSSYASTINVASKINFTGGMQVGGIDTTGGNYRNRIQNGEFSVNQRANTDYPITISSASGPNWYGVDRWAAYWYNVSGTFTPSLSFKQTTDHPIKGNSGKCLEIQCNSTGTTANNVDFFAVWHSIEAHNIADIFTGSSAQPMTLSFWVKSNKVGTYCVELRDETNSAYGIIKEYTVQQSGVWEKKVLSIPAPTFTTVTPSGSRGVTVQWMMASGFTPTYRPDLASAINQWYSSVGSNGVASNNQTNLFANAGNYLRLTDIQLEPGTVATAFERKSYAENLEECQRYYQLSAVSCYQYADTSGRSITINTPWQTTMRATPTASERTSLTSTNVSATYPPSDVLLRAEGCTLRAVSNGTGTVDYRAIWQFSSEI